MQRIEYHTDILKNGYIPVPPEIQDQLLLKPDQRVKIIIEIPESQEKTEKRYSFEKVRELLKGIKGNMSDEIIAQRDDRI